MNNGERILRATGEFASLTWLIIILCYSFISRQVKQRSRPIMLMVNFAATLCSHLEHTGWYIKSKIHLKRVHKTFKFRQIFVGVHYILENILLYFFYSWGGIPNPSSLSSRQNFIYYVLIINKPPLAFQNSRRIDNLGHDCPMEHTLWIKMTSL